MQKIKKTSKCPGCWNLLDANKVLNRLSRYDHGYLCGDCGRRETHEKDFICKQNEYIKKFLARPIKDYKVKKDESEYLDRTDPFAILGLRLLNKKLYHENKDLRLENKTLPDENKKLRLTIKTLRVRVMEAHFGKDLRARTERVVQGFVKRFYERVNMWDQNEREYIRYDPRKGSRAFTVRRQQGFTVVYSIATVNNYNTAMASYWINEEGKPRYVHLDLTRLVDAILAYHELKYYDPVTGKEL